VKRPEPRRLSTMYVTTSFGVWKVGGGKPFRALRECMYCKRLHRPGPHFCEAKGRMVAA